MDKGTVSNVISVAVLVVGWALPPSAIQALVLTAGMYAFSGGITNALAVKMLFDRIPGLVGSGVIPARFEQIRRKIKELILEHFFNEEYLRRYLAENAGDVDWSKYVKTSSGSNPMTAFVEAQWDELTSPQLLQPLITLQVEKLMDSSFGGFLHIVGAETIRGMVGKFVGTFLDSMKGRVFEASERFQLDFEGLGLELDQEQVLRDLREQVDRLLEQKLKQLDSAQVKRMMEEVIRHHLGWLVVWGNVFGGLIGVAAYFIAGKATG
jgi:uncharacterized membrane protein YheB (UPF0754 family)